MHGLCARICYQKHVVTIETMSEASEQIKAKVLFVRCKGWRFAISMRALIFLRLTQITSCFAASAAQSGVTPLILWASNTTARFSSRLTNLCNFTPRIHQKLSQKVRIKSKICQGWGHAPTTPHYMCFNRILEPPFSKF